ncbi:MAG: CPBP family intramembrane metalloprotease [Chloroflexi bacterium]|nr:CPBP family intramembrane metalloprotease [Chloroflexota bacterium]
MAPQRLLGFGALFGLGMIALAVVWQGVLRGNVSITDWFPGESWPVDVLLGSALGVTFALGAWRLLDVLPSMQRIERLLADSLQIHRLRYVHALLLGLVAGIPEEILFRGAIQPTLGWPLTALLFGALHAITRTYFVYATVAGLLLGGLALWRDGLWAAIAAHSAVDAVLFALLVRKWRAQPAQPISAD